MRREGHVAFEGLKTILESAVGEEQIILLRKPVPSDLKALSEALPRPYQGPKKCAGLINRLC